KISLPSMEQGTVAKKTDKGFGFIKRDGQDKDLFFHANELQNISFDELQEGDKVSFEVGESPKGPNAVNVSKI
ncbi:MAG TPA: cold shock domain-containing protein, partial [Candidatus Paceibacterota bacterium]|nr:cold shock domain-containing protein [Candidatus Paceibacterota bacterium]